MKAQNFSDSLRVSFFSKYPYIWAVLFVGIGLSFFLASFKKSKTTRSVVFYTGSIPSAQKRAKTEGKLYFVDFVASWCAPCKQMDESTYTNSELIRFIEDNFIAVKIDIDDFDGYEYKMKYNIKVLPTIIVFDANGKILERKEESMGSEAMLNMLRSHLARKNTTQQAPNPPENPRISDVEKPVEKKETTTPTPTPKPTPTAPPVKKSSYKILDVKTDGKYFGLQIGAFKSLETIEKEVARLQQIGVTEPLLIHKFDLKGVPTYRMLIGKFADKAKAEAYSEKMKAKGLLAVVKDYSKL